MPRARLGRLLQRLAVAALCCAAVGAAQGQRIGPLGPLEADGEVTYFVAEGEPSWSFRRSDPELAQWALAAWERASHGAFKFVPTDDEEAALVRLYWAPPIGGQYGEMVSLEVAGKRGAAVYIRPDTRALGEDIADQAAADPLFRDAIVYLTCLHELGHALGLEHTDDFADVMYFFGFGGDIPEFFGRYRRALKSRADIEQTSGLSAGDQAQLDSLYHGRQRPVLTARATETGFTQRN